MLCATDDGRRRHAAARWTMTGLLAAAALGASALRGPAQGPGPAALELMYVGDGSKGFLAVRPAALLGRPEMAAVRESFDRRLRAELRGLGLGDDCAVPPGDVELAVGPVELKRFADDEPQPGGGRHALTAGLSMIRMARDFDWAARLRALRPLAQVAEPKPGEFELRHPLFGPEAAKVCVTGRMLAGAEPHAADPARWGEAGRRALGAGLAVGVDNRAGHWTDALADVAEAKPWLAAVGRPDHAAVGLLWGETVTVNVYADYPTEEAAAAAERSVTAARVVLLAAVQAAGAPPVAAELVRSAAVRREGKLVCVEARSAVRWADVLGSLLLCGKAQVEVQQSKP